MARTTRQRAEILEALEHASTPVSAQDLFVALRGDGASISLATVYRQLQRLAEEGVADRLHRDSGEHAFRDIEHRADSAACASAAHRSRSLAGAYDGAAVAARPARRRTDSVARASRRTASCSSSGESNGNDRRMLVRPVACAVAAAPGMYVIPWRSASERRSCSSMRRLSVTQTWWPPTGCAAVYSPPRCVARASSRASRRSR